jgi:hypothetical protein
MRDVARSSLASADVVVLTQPYLFPVCRDLRNVPVVYDSQNCESELKRLMYRDDQSSMALVDSVIQIESAALRRADVVIAVSEEDVAALRSLTSTMARFELVANGGGVSSVPFMTGLPRAEARSSYLSSLQRRGTAVGATRVAAFVGSGHPPNIDAARRIIQTAPMFPELFFVLLGSHVAALNGLPETDNVLARGVVSEREMRHVLSLCDVALNPMGSGSGTNIKMIDYFGAGAPVISSATGARGLGALPGVHYVECGTGFANELSAVLDDPVGASVRAIAARRRADELDWRRLAELFASAVLGAIP